MDTTPDPIAHAAARRWLGLAVAVLIVAGVFAVLLVFARMPPFDRLVTDPAFFRRCLVVHVNLALVVWFVSFASALVSTLPGPRAPWTAAGPFVGAAGVGLLAVSAWIPGAEPVLANYVPVIDHPLFVGGLATFGAGVLLSVLDGRLLPRDGEPVDAAIPGLRAAGIGLAIAALTAISSYLAVPTGLDANVRYEALHWGVGHVLQLVSETAMVAVWLTLVAAVTGRPAMSRAWAGGLFACLLAPWLAAPLLPMGEGHGAADFTALMRWSIFPVVLVFLVACVRALVRARAKLSDPRVAGFAVSAGLTLLGFGIGAMIRGSNTIVPAHYHASIGAVTTAFMTVTPMLLDRLGVGVPSVRSRLATLQPLVYGGGQMVFATGFALAGAHGMARKAYGAEQAARGVAETIGLGVMGVGGLVAVAGGVLFLWLVVRRWTTRASLAQLPTPRSPWIDPASTPSNV